MYFLYQKYFLLSRYTTQSYINDKLPTHTQLNHSQMIWLVTPQSLVQKFSSELCLLQLDIPHIHSITSHNHTSHSCSKNLWNRIHTLCPKCETGKLIKFSTLTLTRCSDYVRSSIFTIFLKHKHRLFS